MPKIKVPRSKILPTTEIADQQQLISTDTFAKVAAAGKSLGQSIGDFGSTVAINTLRAQSEEEFTRAKLDYETAFRTFQTELLTDTDYAGYTKRFNAWHDDTAARLEKRVTHRGAKTKVFKQFKLNRAIRGRTIDTNAQNSLVRQTRVALPDKIESFVTEELLADTPETLEKAETERKVYFQTLIETGVLNEVEAQSLEADYREVKGKRILENSVVAIATEKGWDAALSFLNDPKETKELVNSFGLELADIDRVLEDVTTQAKLSKAREGDELRAQKEEDGQQLFDLLTTNELGTKAIDATVLSADEKFKWRQRSIAEADRLSKGIKITTDNPTFLRLDDAILDISIGSRRRSEVQNLIADARARLSDDDFRSLGEKLNTTHVSYIARSISDARRYGESQILKRDPVTFEFTGSADDEESLRNYNLDLDNMIAAQQKAGKELEPKDIIRFSRDLAIVHRKPPKEKVKAGIQTQQEIILTRAAARRRVNNELDRLKQLGDAPNGLESIWSELSGDEKEDVLGMRDKGRTAEEILQYFKNVTGE